MLWEQSEAANILAVDGSDIFDWGTIVQQSLGLHLAAHGFLTRTDLAGLSWF